MSKIKEKFYKRYYLHDMCTIKNFVQYFKFYTSGVRNNEGPVEKTIIVHMGLCIHLCIR